MELSQSMDQLFSNQWYTLQTQLNKSRRYIVDRFLL